METRAPPGNHMTIFDIFNIITLVKYICQTINFLCLLESYGPHVLISLGLVVLWFNLSKIEIFSPVTWFCT